jgi:hypothetical protein
MGPDVRQSARRFHRFRCRVFPTSSDTSRAVVSPQGRVRRPRASGLHGITATPLYGTAAASHALLHGRSGCSDPAW